jgi:5-hydroxyisourate hydrolase
VSAISTHVLDTAAGCPAAGMNVRLEHAAPAGNEEIASATTDSGGRITSLGPELLEPGTYRLVFDTGGYLGGQPGNSSNGSGTDKPAFFPEVTVTFTVADDREHYHVPLLMSPFGYSTYRGS